MSLPELVRERLGEESPQARVSLGGDDQLVTTPTRTLVYRAEGLLSGESVEEHPHSAERVAVTEGRRKSTVRLDHGIDGESEFTVPTNRLDDLLEPLFEGILGATGVLDDGEEVSEVYRQGELTLVITEGRVIKHIGAALWDTEYEEYPFEEVTRLDVEAGDVSSQIIIEVDGRPERIKVPSEEARVIRQRVEEALLGYHDARSYAAFREQVTAEVETETVEGEADGAGGDDGGSSRTAEGTDDFGGIGAIGERDRSDPADGPAEAQTSRTEPEEAGGGGQERDENRPREETDVNAEEATELRFGPEAAGGNRNEAIAEEVAELRAAVERQTELLEKHHRTLEQLIEELRQGR